MKLKHIFSRLLPFLLFMLGACILSGCKTADAVQAEETEESAVKVETVSDCESDTATEPEAKTAKKKKKQQSEKVADGPGDAPVPTEETKDKLEEMESTLAPIKTIPTAPKT